MGVRVLDSEEVERNVLDQAATLSAKESPEFKKRFFHKFKVIFQLHLFVPILFRKQRFKTLESFKRSINTNSRTRSLGSIHFLQC